jgi:late competence protein required for DNA uptake (superfamily II DNA/RNA helicase)
VLCKKCKKDTYKETSFFADDYFYCSNCLDKIKQYSDIYITLDKEEDM